MRREENKVAKFAIIVLALTMIALILVSGTYAKYTSEFEATSNARVAKWSFKVNNKDIATSEAQELTINLFETIKDTTDAEEVGSNETDVKAGTAAQAIIAPGTAGEFTISVQNLSEVTAKAEIAFDVTTTLPLEFKVGNGEWKAASSFTGDAAKVTLATLAMEQATATDTVVQWRWKYNSGAISGGKSTENATGDAADTTLGVAGTATAAVKVTVTATQVN